MMKTQYKVIETKQPEFPIRNLIEISGDRNLTASLLAFGPNYFNNNIAEMQKSYSHPQTGKIISFEEPTTAESILVASCDFGNRAKPQIFDPRWVQAGRAFKASEWVVANPPRDNEGNVITDERILKNFLNGVTKVNGIYRLPNGKLQGVRDCSFVPYESFKQEVQSGADFARSGLARGLEYSDGEKAPNLEVISSKENYPNGVDVFGFYPENKVRVVGLNSDMNLDYHRLNVLGHYWYDNYNGFAFGVLETGEASAPEK